MEGDKEFKRMAVPSWREQILLKFKSRSTRAVQVC